jgi:beta-lactamase regulating signal transducer with metallopeptidase domain/tetratricopeptide (TPR) repeat protein
MNATTLLTASGIRFALDIALKVTFVFLAAELALAGLRRAPASLRHLVATAGLAAALLLPALALVLPRVALPVLPSLPAAVKPSAPALLPKPAGAASALAPAASRLRAASVGAAEVAGLAAPPSIADATKPLQAPSGARSFPWLSLVLAAWAAGALFFGMRLAVGWARVRRIAREADPIREADWTYEREAASRRLGVRRPVELLESPEVPVAMTSGLFRPLLLLGRAARTWVIERRRIVLLHEIAHVRRGDWLTLVLAEAAVSIYWFHPAAWHLVAIARRNAEQAADDLVLESGTKPSVYAGHLLGIFRSLSTVGHPVVPALGIARPSDFEERLRAILDNTAARRALPKGRAHLAAAGVFAAAALVTLIEPWAPVAGAAVLPDGDPAPTALLPAQIGSHDLQTCPRGVARTAARVTAAPRVPEQPLPETGRSLPAIWEVLPSIETQKTGFVLASNGGEQHAKRSGAEWYSRGMDLHHDERYDQSIEAFKNAIDAGYREGASSYNIACGYALKGNANEAFAWLQRAADEGFDVSSYLGRDDDLDSLKSDPRWKEIKKTARKKESTRHEAESRAVAARYERLVANAGTSGEPYFEIGKELLNADRYDLSAKAFHAAADRGYRVGTSLYNEACALSRADNKQAALDLLQKSLDAGFDQPDMFRSDDDLDNIRGEQRFAELAREAKDLELPGYGNGRWGWSGSGFSEHRTKWREAARRFEDYARKHPEQGRAWFNVGFASLAGDRPEAALEAFQKALDLGYRKPTTQYNLACSYARLDQKDKAFEWLFKALDAGFGASGTLRGDEDLDNLRGDPRFRKALEIAKAKERAKED